MTEIGRRAGSHTQQAIIATKPLTTSHVTCTDINLVTMPASSTLSPCFPAIVNMRNSLRCFLLITTFALTICVAFQGQQANPPRLYIFIFNASRQHSET